MRSAVAARRAQEHGRVARIKVLLKLRLAEHSEQEISDAAAKFRAYRDCQVHEAVEEAAAATRTAHALAEAFHTTGQPEATTANALAEDTQPALAEDLQRALDGSLCVDTVIEDDNMTEKACSEHEQTQVSVPDLQEELQQVTATENFDLMEYIMLMTELRENTTAEINAYKKASAADVDQLRSELLAAQREKFTLGEQVELLRAEKSRGDALQRNLHECESELATSRRLSEHEAQKASSMFSTLEQNESLVASLHSELHAMTTSADTEDDAMMDELNEMRARGEITDLEELTMLEAYQGRKGAGVDQSASKPETLAATNAKKEHRATYMRYYRAVGQPTRVGRDLYEAVKNGKGSLFDLWLECSEDWGQVQIMHQQYELKRNIEFDIENYLTRAQLEDKYKSSVIVDNIISDKKARGGVWVKKHPECPELEEATLYLCWSAAGSKKEQETGTKTTLDTVKHLDMEHAETREAVVEMASRTISTMACARSMPAAEPTPAPKAKAKSPAEKSPVDRARAAITRLANQTTAKIRILQALRVDLEQFPVDDADDKRLFEVKHRGLFELYTAIDAKLSAAMALKSRATVEFLETTLSEQGAQMDKLNPQVAQLESLVAPAKPKAKGKVKSKAKAKAAA